MNAERSEQPVEREREVLLRAIWDGRAAEPGSAEWERLVAGNETLRAELEEAYAIVPELRAALRPEPLPEALVERIEARLDQVTTARQTRRLWPVPVAGLAVAAAVILAVVGLWDWRRETQPPAASPLLSADEAAEIVAVYAVLAWSGPLDYSLERVRSELDEIEEQVTGTAETSVRPWGLEDEWDVPLDDGSTLRPPTESPICRACGADGRRTWSNELRVL